MSATPPGPLTGSVNACVRIGVVNDEISIVGNVVGQGLQLVRADVLGRFAEPNRQIPYLVGVGAARAAVQASALDEYDCLFARTCPTRVFRIIVTGSDAVASGPLVAEGFDDVVDEGCNLSVGMVT